MTQDCRWNEKRAINESWRASEWNQLWYHPIIKSTQPQKALCLLIYTTVYIDLINDYDGLRSLTTKGNISCDSKKRKCKLIYHYRKSSVIARGEERKRKKGKGLPRDMRKLRW